MKKKWVFFSCCSGFCKRWQACDKKGQNLCCLYNRPYRARSYTRHTYTLTFKTIHLINNFLLKIYLLCTLIRAIIVVCVVEYTLARVLTNTERREKPEDKGNPYSIYHTSLSKRSKMNRRNSHTVYDSTYLLDWNCEYECWFFRI